MKILSTIENLTIEAQEILQALGKVDCLELSQKELESKIGEYDVLLVGLGLSVNARVLSNGKNLKAVATATTGLDHIDVNLAEQKGIKIISLKNETEFLNTITGTAELAFGLMIALMRFLTSAAESVKQGKWQRENFRGCSLRGKTLGIVGLGRLGAMMAKYGKAFAMNVIYFDPNKEKSVDFETLLAKSDIISLHIHLNEETENMFDKNVFSKMKSTAYLINTSRGKIVNENDLIEALEKEQIAGYGADVLSSELEFQESGQIKGSALAQYAKSNRNVLIVPHIGGMTTQSRISTDIFIAEKVKQAIQIQKNG